MAERLTSIERTALMGRIKGSNTGPELVVRRLVHGLGYRFVPNDKRLPGTPDLAFPARRKVVLVHGCFWHMHDCGRGFRPATNTAFWDKKLKRNVMRDAEVLGRLDALGWGHLSVFECEARPAYIDSLQWKLIAFLEG